MTKREFNIVYNIGNTHGSQGVYECDPDKYKDLITVSDEMTVDGTPFDEWRKMHYQSAYDKGFLEAWKRRDEADYTVEELHEFLHGIALHLCSLQSAETWKHDEKDADKILWLQSLEGRLKEDIERARRERYV